jgi:hypothetical protein
MTTPPYLLSSGSGITIVEQNAFQYVAVGALLNLASVLFGEARGGEDRAGVTPLPRPGLMLLEPDDPEPGPRLCAAQSS